MVEIELFVTSIGQQAKRILSNAHVASILGVTSRGIFLQVGPDWVIFLSHEPTSGPLTLNLNQGIPTSANIGQSQSVDIKNGRFLFPGSMIQIDFSSAKEWVIPPHPQPVLSSFERNERIRAVYQEVNARRGGSGLSPILADLLKTGLTGDPIQPAFLDRIDHRQLYQDLRAPDENQISAHLQPFLGLGSGLTPSGDDLIGGFLLTYNRYQDILHPPFPLSALNRVVIELAYQKTALLSANLIECASLGQADERLILALDGMLAGTLDPASSAKLLLSWGNSSGCDALAGMALAAYQRS